MTNSGRKRPGRQVVRVKFGSAHVPIYQGSVRGDTRFTVSFYQNGRRVRRTFDSLAKATEEARTAAMKIQQGLAEVADMRVADRQNYNAATSLLGSLSVPLVAAVEEYVRCRELLGGSPLLSAIEEHVRRTNGLRMGASVADVVKEFMAAKEEDGVSKRYLSQLRSDLNRFTEFFRCPILHVNSEQIDEWLRSLKVAPRTRNGTLTSVRTLFSFAKSRSYLPKNEITEADALNKSKVGDTDTVIFEPAVMRKLLDAAPPQLIPFLAIGALAGLRSAEIARLEWSAINFELGIIEIRAGQAKTASRRIVPVSENLRAWIAPLARTGPVIHTLELYRDVSALAAKLGIDWPRNVLRHSYISYRLPIVKTRMPSRLKRAIPPPSSSSTTVSLRRRSKLGSGLQSIP